MKSVRMALVPTDRSDVLCVACGGFVAQSRGKKFTFLSGGQATDYGLHSTCISLVKSSRENSESWLREVDVADDEAEEAEEAEEAQDAQETQETQEAPKVEGKSLEDLKAVAQHWSREQGGREWVVYETKISPKKTSLGLPTIKQGITIRECSSRDMLPDEAEVVYSTNEG